MNFDFLTISWWQELSKCKQSVVKFSLWNFPCEISLPDLKFLIFFARVFCGVIGELADLEAGFKLNSRSICTNSTWRTISTKASNKCLSSWWFLTIWWGPMLLLLRIWLFRVFWWEREKSSKKKELRCLLSSEFLSQLTNWWNCFIALEYKYYYVLYGEEDPKKVHSVLVS